MKTFRWIMGIIAVLLFVWFLTGCGADEANIDNQEFFNDFGTYQLNFYTADCHDQLAVSETTNTWTLHINNTQHYNIYGIDREVIHDVGIEYKAENFSLIKRFDGTITLDFQTEHCEISIYAAQ